MSIYDSPIEHVAGVGPKRARPLRALSICTIDDLLWYSPFRYEDRKVDPEAQLVDGQRATLLVAIASPPSVRYNGKRSTVTAQCRLTDGQTVRGVWYNRPYVRDQLLPGQSLLVTGKYDSKRNSLIVEHYEPCRPQASVHSDRVVPVYAVSEGLTTAQLRTIIHAALRQYGDSIEEPLPAELRQKYKLMDKRQAISELHFPTNGVQLSAARRRLMFEEFFLFQLKLQAFRVLRHESQSALILSGAQDHAHAFAKSLPFQLTLGQKTAIRAIVGDLCRDEAMNRLLQGDVGSGKTAVAFAALYAVAKAGYQGAMMAPTEILAEQHYHQAVDRLHILGVRVLLLTGNTRAAERETILRSVQSGECDVLFGTHALLEELVSFSRLALVVTDEQHRFGVLQRKLLREKGRAPHVLFLSATPIPRTLALAIFGDMDVTTITDRPPGRIPIETKWLPPERESQVWRFVRREVAKGRQAYVVAPLVTASEKLSSVADTEQLFDRLRQVFAGFRVGLLHGQMSIREKEASMREFVGGQVNILVATTVIEVGVDVPNASVMVVFDADRFGLSQLHQLRGRVGRGPYPSYCLLLAKPTTSTGEERLKAMEQTEDGFALAEKDLSLRGPGDLFGYRQSGIPEFRVGDLQNDRIAMRVARDEATLLVRNRLFWVLPAYSALRHTLNRAQVIDEPLAD